MTDPCPECGAEGDCSCGGETGVSPLDTAFSTPDEVHATMGGIFAGLKRPHRYPSPPERWESEAWYWKFGVVVAKGILALAVVVTTYTQIPSVI